MDAQVWAEEFMSTLVGTFIDKEQMAVWFANAIMCGYDNATNKLQSQLARYRECLEWYGDAENWNEGDMELGYLARQVLNENQT
jgi:hypothetical protein